MAEHSVNVPASALTRVRTFMRAYESAPADADIEVRLGKTERGEGAVLVSISGEMHAFTATEARKLADLAEQAIGKFPKGADATGLPNLILALRYGADRADG